VILDTTQPLSRVGLPAHHARQLGLPLSVKVSYTIKNVFFFRIKPNLHLPHPFTIVSQNNVDAVYKPDQSETLKVKELKSLLQKSWGVITLSRVGFDGSHKHAVVYAQLTYCGLCGEGEFIYLEKEGKGWHIVGRTLTWIS
jgi:hypothetical protein